MNTHLLHAQSTVAIHSLYAFPTIKISKPPVTRIAFTSSSRTQFFLFRHPYKKLKPICDCVANSEGSGATNKWEKWVPRNFIAADKVFKWISEATSSPIGQYISSPITFLHSVDPRIKLAWLLVLVVIPARSHIFVRFGLVFFLAFLSIWMQPRQVWMDQLGRVATLCGFLFIMLALGTDSAPSLLYSRAPPPSLMGLPSFPKSLEGYVYVIMKFGPLQITRKGLLTASTSACLTFTIFQSASLCLTSTTPEQLAFALRWFIYPMSYFGLPVAEIILTLLLSLRFIGLVFDEVRNVALGIISRRINWQLLTTMETIDVFFTYIWRIFRNIFTHSEQISQAMIVRGFRGDCNSYKIFLSVEKSSVMANLFSFFCLLLLIGAATLSNRVIL